MRAVPLLFVNQQEAAEMLGVSVQTFKKLRNTDARLVPAVIPQTKGTERYLVSDLEEWARAVKYPTGDMTTGGSMWGDESAA